MAKLYFRYGAMGSSKTANALMVRYNFIENGKNVILVKPDKENRDGTVKVKSRIGLEGTAFLWSDFLKLYNHGYVSDFDAVIVDEAQFLREADINLLANIVDDYDIPVLCYGLRTDFTTHFFEGARRLMEIADVIEEIKTICWCGKRACINARIDQEGKVVRDGEQIVMGGNETYESLCRKHYKTGKTKRRIKLAQGGNL